MVRGALLRLLMVDERRRRFLRGRPLAQPVPALRPPWAQRPDDRFTEACTRCGHCVSACPSKVLRAGDGAYPEIDFSAAGCTLCGECVLACTSGALRRTAADAPFPWAVQAAGTCLTRHGVECRICGDACDARALRFVPARGGVAQITVLSERCTGCGECLSTCPVRALALAPKG